MRKTERIVYLHGIHSGGGLTLLEDVVRLAGADDRYCFVFDARVRPLLCLENIKNKVFFSAGPIGRYQSELFVWKKANKNTTILSMNSIPFLLPISGRQIVFFQNVNLLVSEQFLARGYRIRQIMFRFCAKRVAKFIVQTQSVKKMLVKKTKQPIEVCSFLDEKILSSCEAISVHRKSKEGSNVFVYIADAARHKNHMVLMQAWQLLYQNFPDFKGQLIITVSEEVDNLWSTIKKTIDVEALSVSNCGTVSRETVFSLYQQANALIYPSLGESFGLPLVEASLCGCDIIAAERDYVRDVCEPVETFDPTSSVSLARSIARYVGYSWPSAMRRSSTKSFLEKCFLSEEG